MNKIMFIVIVISCYMISNAYADFAPRGEKVPFAFAISGGISLGSYEAGLNWAYTRYLNYYRDEANDGEYGPVLVAASGASAGSINALLTAASYCRDSNAKDADEPPLLDTVSDNIFKNTWENVGIDELLPDKNNKYNHDDSILSRKPISDRIKYIINSLSKNIYRECSVPIAFIVTRTQPEILSVDSLQVKNDRFTIPVIMTAKNKKIKFEQFIVNSMDKSHGNIIYLPGVRNEDKIIIDNDTVVNAIMASSAFPFAFSPVKLQYCAKKEISEKKYQSLSCPDGYSLEDSYFVDGGVFDNVPLGTAKALAEPWIFDGNAEDILKNSRRVTYFYLDPNNLRNKNNISVENEHQKLPSCGIMGSARFLSGAFDTGTNYELYKQLSSGEWNHKMADITREVVRSLKACKQSPYLYTKIYYGELVAEFQSLKSPYPSTLITAIIAELENWQQQYENDLSSLENVEQPTGIELQARRKSQIVKLKDIARHIHLNQIGNNIPMTLKESELESFINSATGDNLGDRRIVLSSRFSPLTGTYLGHFGAFLDKDFRLFDYYAGVYDAVIDLVNFECSIQVGGDPELCTTVSYKKISEEILDIDSSVEALTVYKLLGYNEKGIDKNDLPDAKSNTQIIADTFMLNKSLEFKEFIKKIKNDGYKINSNNGIIKEIFDLKSDDDYTMLYPILRRCLNRIEYLEKKEKKELPAASIIHGLTIMSNHAAFTLLGSKEKFQLNQGFASTDLRNSFPYEAYFDLRNGGFGLSWEPTLRIKNKISINSKFTPIGFDKFGKEKLFFTQNDLYAVYHRDDVILSSLGIGPVFNHTWGDWKGYNEEIHVGGAIYGSFILDKVRITFGTRSFDDTFKNLYITFGITDVQGLGEVMFRSFR